MSTISFKGKLIERVNMKPKVKAKIATAITMVIELLVAESMAPATASAVESYPGQHKQKLH